ncbi:MAG: pyridoxamine 5'-phosphate oxidase family protein [Firmicutes bacterium]|nr:pyridoxamine 5'-phosphate oxidase family protein [Bacillota bacterium]
MDLALKIQGIRKSSGLSQGKFASKLFVTRQAVSRWETGETTPTIDTLKSMFEFFSVNPSHFFEVSPICQSCSMPLQNPENLGQNPDKSVNLDYCKYCFVDGSLEKISGIEEMIDSTIEAMKAENYFTSEFTEADERAHLIKTLPTLKRWKRVATINRAKEFIKSRCVNGGTARSDAYCTISLIDFDGYPTSAAITPATSEGLETIWFGTSLDSNKARRIKKKPKAGICFNSGDVNISLVGAIEIVSDLATKKEVLYEEITQMPYYPQGMADPNLIALKFTTKRFDIWFGDTEAWEKGKINDL